MKKFLCLFLAVAVAAISSPAALALSVNSDDVVTYIKDTFGYGDNVIGYDSASGTYIINTYASYETFKGALSVDSDQNEKVMWTVARHEIEKKMQTIITELENNNITDDVSFTLSYSIPGSFYDENDPCIPLLILQNDEIVYDLGAL
ncbi:MAG: hypothetical protein PHY64_01295 [Eubacteriales bacterium]|nr:hypothetical protein [Eubacteriales bacterium]